MKAANSPRSLLLFRLSLLLLLLLFLAEHSEAGQRRVSIPDDLQDVLDDEEDEAWKQWGQKKTSSSSDLPPPDFSRMDPAEIQAELTKRQTGPAIGFVKLRFGVSRSKEDIPLIAMKWSKVLRAGSVAVKFMAVDMSTIMFTLERGQDIEDVKEFIFSQPEAYEVKIGDQIFRRPGDPPLDEVLADMQMKKSGARHDSPGNSQSSKEEL